VRYLKKEEERFAGILGRGRIVGGSISGIFTLGTASPDST
jgi:hypothetical protein